MTPKMTASDFLGILSQNGKFTLEFIDKAMNEFGWKLVSLANGVKFHDGHQLYTYTRP